MNRLKELALWIYNNVNIEKTYLILAWAISILSGDKFTSTISFTALLVLWYIDKKFEKKKTETTSDGDGNVDIKF